jgi:hypothetical protein
MILQGEGLPDVGGGGAADFETIGLLLDGATDFHIFHSVHFKSVTVI